MMIDIKIDKIIRSKRKTIALMISDDAMLVVRAPMMTPLEYIENLVFIKRFWIHKKKIQVSENGGSAKSKEFVNGEEFLYLGEPVQLKIENREDITLTDYLYFPEKHLTDCRKKMIEWCKQKALEVLTERTHLYSQLTGWQFKSISVTHAESRWGSCGPSGSIHFSWKLIMAPLRVIDYVVVHELAHLVEKNHSARFWDKVKTVIPDYKERQKWIKENGRKLTI